MSVVIETSVGDLTIDLLIKERPKCCFNFLKLCKMKFYNLCFFHRIEKDFIAQTGDPTATGKGGYSVYYLLNPEECKFFPAEVVPKIKHSRLGTVSMVNNGDDMHGSQFFFTLREDLDNLDGVHTVFGYVVEGEETLHKINEMHFIDILITHAVILHDPFEDPPALTAIRCESPEPSEEILERIAIANNIDDKKMVDPKEQESKAAATILEMIGDIPSEDVLPPDNVLFVCKLNPVTKEEDLRIIFERFGTVKSCEIIKDFKSGDSLQYGFIEFERTEDCENAYFKMDNVIIDERRIHVDFSQSVAKMKNSDRFKDYTSKYRLYKESKGKKVAGVQKVSRDNEKTHPKKNPNDHHRNNKYKEKDHRSYRDDRERDRYRGSEYRHRHDDRPNRYDKYSRRDRGENSYDRSDRRSEKRPRENSRDRKNVKEYHRRERNHHRHS